MAIVLNSTSNSHHCFAASPYSWAHTVAAGDDRILNVVFVWYSTSRTVTSVTYSGQNLARHPDSPGLWNPCCNMWMDWWYMVAPPVGVANIIITLSGNTNVVGAFGIAHDNVNQDDPFGAFERDFVASAANGIVDDTIASDIDELVVAGYFSLKGSAGTGIASVRLGLTDRSNLGTKGCGTSWTAGFVADEVGASPTQNYGGQVAFGSLQNGLLNGTTLLPVVPPAGRQVKYFYDMWSPEPKVRDEAGREVPLNEIRPNNWIEAEGIAIPSLVPAENNIVDPSRSRIVEVNADDRQGTIKTDISQFADVLIARAAAGRG